MKVGYRHTNGILAILIYYISDQYSIFGNPCITSRMAQVSRHGRSLLNLPYAVGPISFYTFLLLCLGSCSQHLRCAILFRSTKDHLTLEQRPSFFAMRLTLGLICSLCEAQFYRSVVVHVSDRVGRYMLFMLLFSAGMWNASTGMSCCWCPPRSAVTHGLISAFLPSTFAMYFNMLAMSFALRPSTKRADDRVLFATICFAIGAIVGWPFSIVISFPFVLEELFFLSGDKVSPALMGQWIGARWIRMLGCVTLAAFLLVRPYTTSACLC